MLKNNLRALFVPILLASLLIPNNCIAQKTTTADSSSKSPEEEIQSLKERIAKLEKEQQDFQAVSVNVQAKPRRDYEFHTYACFQANMPNSSSCEFLEHVRVEFRSFSGSPLRLRLKKNRFNTISSRYSNGFQETRSQPKVRGGWGISFDTFASNSLPDPDPETVKSPDDHVLPQAQKGSNSQAGITTASTNSSQQTELNAKGISSYMFNLFLEGVTGNFFSGGIFGGIGITTTRESNATAQQAGVNKQALLSGQAGIYVSFTVYRGLAINAQLKTATFYPEDLNYSPTLNAPAAFAGFDRISFFRKTDLNVGLRYSTNR